MYSILVVDDFAIDRQNLLDAIGSFNDLPVYVLDACENAYDALEQIRNVGVDILITDVEMPSMSGIELADTLRREHFKGRIIFCSLYDKLHYLKGAIAVNSDGYLTKPFSRDELEACLRRVLLQLVDIERQRRQLESLRTAMQSHRLRLTREFFSDVLLGYELSQGEIQRRMQQLEIQPSDRFRVALIEIDMRHASTNLVEGGASIVPYRVNQALKQDTGWSMPYYTVRMSERYYTVIFCYSDEDDPVETRRRTENALNDFAAQMRESAIMLTASFSPQISSVTEIRAQYEQCRSRLNRKERYDGDAVIFADGDSAAVFEPTRDLQEVQNDIRRLLSCDSGIEQEAAAYAQTLMEGLSAPQQQMLSHYILGSIQYITQQEGGGCDRFLTELNDLMARSMRLETYQEVTAFTAEVIVSAWEELHQQDTDKYTELVEQIKRFIQQSDLKVIHLGLIADHFSYSPNYLNHIFKSCTGDTILDYITQCRIRRAKTLMQETGMHLSEIATEIGYSHATYLSIVFKRQEGMTPKQFMERSR